jgi:S1-C subfamily serine protease
MNRRPRGRYNRGVALPLRPLLLLALVAGCRPQAAPTGGYPPAADPAARLLAVRLLVLDFETLQLAEASAFFASPAGVLVTCAHVLDRGTPLGVVFPDGRRATVTEVLASDAVSDLALLRVDGGPHTPLPLAAAPAGPGQPLLAVTKDGTLPVTCLGRGVDAEVGEVTVFAAAGAGPGASGGALVDAEGRVVGVIRGGFEDGGREGVAVPVDRLAAFVRAVTSESEEES